MFTMDQDIVFECQNHSQVTLRHKVATTPCLSSKKVEEKDRKTLSVSRYRHLNRLDGDLRGFNRSYSSSIDCESMNSRKLNADGDNEVLKRGSMYQSSNEVRRMRKQREGRRKVDFGCIDDAFISFEIVDHVPTKHIGSKSNQFPDKQFLSLVSSNADSVNLMSTRCTEFPNSSFRDLPNKPPNTDNTCLDFMPAKGCAVDDSVEICLHSVDKLIPREVAPGSLEPGLLKEQKSHCYEKIHPESYMKNNRERDSVKTLPKCLSENAKISHAVSNLDHGITDASVLKTVFSPLKRIFDPIMKSKSLRDSFPAGTHNYGSVFVHPTDIGLKAAPEKSMLNEISIKEDDRKPGACLIQGESVPAAISPAHLHGILRLDTENGYPSFEFSIQDPEEVLSAKTWKTDSAFNWVYTFHSSKKKINTSRRTKDNNESLPPLVGQMHVSFYLCSEVRENGSLFNSTVTEFVLYDIARARRNFSVEERSKCCTDSTQAVSSNVVEDLIPTATPERNKSVEYPDSSRLGLDSRDSKASTSFPWSSKDLHPQHEIAAVVIQVPFNKKESPKDEKGFGRQGNQKASKCSPIDQKKKTKNHMSPATIEVVTPSGNHGLPNTDEAGRPSSLLDRWRCGGGCDCGGWDMSCPIIVFDNQRGDDWINHSTLEFQAPMLLFLQGSKENLPALMITADEKGQYSVYFHAQFSVLQAFSICTAILHSSEVCSAIVQEKTRQSLYSNSLWLLLEEEPRHLIEAVENEEPGKAKEGVEQMSPLFSLDPPFSPIGRV